MNTIQTTNFKTKDTVVPVSNKSNLTGSVIPERFNSISLPTGKSIALPELSSVSEPKQIKQFEQKP